MGFCGGDNNACPTSRTCVDGECVALPGQGDPCDDLSDCRADPELVCFDGTCERPLRDGEGCSNDSECASGACVFNSCTDVGGIGDVCDSDGDCAGTINCSPEHECGGDGAFCSDDFLCVSNICSLSNICTEENESIALPTQPYDPYEPDFASDNDADADSDGDGGDSPPPPPPPEDGGITDEVIVIEDSNGDEETVIRVRGGDGDADVGSVVLPPSITDDGTVTVRITNPARRTLEQAVETLGSNALASNTINIEIFDADGNLITTFDDPIEICLILNEQTRENVEAQQEDEVDSGCGGASDSDDEVTVEQCLSFLDETQDPPVWEYVSAAPKQIYSLLEW